MQSLQYRHKKLVKEDLEYLLQKGNNLADIARLYDMPTNTLRSAFKRIGIIYISKLHNKKCFRENQFGSFRNKKSESAILKMLAEDCFK